MPVFKIGIDGPKTLSPTARARKNSRILGLNVQLLMETKVQVFSVVKVVEVFCLL